MPLSLRNIDRVQGETYLDIQVSTVIQSLIGNLVSKVDLTQTALHLSEAFCFHRRMPHRARFLKSGNESILGGRSVVLPPAVESNSSIRILFDTLAQCNASSLIVRHYCNLNAEQLSSSGRRKHPQTHVGLLDT